MVSPQFLTVSLVIPVYQGEHFLHHLLHQIDVIKSELIEFNIKILEAIFVCDEPIDGSAEIISNHLEADEYDFIKFLELGFNVGQHLATSAGILSARGEWIITLDEDLQHPPKLIPTMLKAALFNSYDLVYIKSRNGTHQSSFYRNQASQLSKIFITTVTGVDTSTISSYRCIRSQVAKCAASTMDKFQYYDVLLQLMTSDKRRHVIHTDIADKRTGSSGYTLKKLLNHFSRLVFSSLISGSRIFLILTIPTFLIILFGIPLLLQAYASNTSSLAPGWISLFSMQILTAFLGSFSIALILKTSSIIMLRGLAPPSFLIINRKSDKYWANCLAKHPY